jgi:hypothetical protein
VKMDSSNEKNMGVGQEDVWETTRCVYTGDVYGAHKPTCSCHAMGRGVSLSYNVFLISILCQDSCLKFVLLGLRPFSSSCKMICHNFLGCAGTTTFRGQ